MPCLTRNSLASLSVDDLQELVMASSSSTLSVDDRLALPQSSASVVVSSVPLAPSLSGLPEVATSPSPVIPSYAGSPFKTSCQPPLVSSWSGVSSSLSSLQPSSVAFLPPVPAVSWPPLLPASSALPLSSLWNPQVFISGDSSLVTSLPSFLPGVLAQNRAQAQAFQALAQAQAFHAQAQAGQAQALAPPLVVPSVLPARPIHAPLPQVASSLQESWSGPSVVPSLAPSGLLLPSPMQDLAPGFHPVPYKTVVAITSGQFVEFASLLAKPEESTGGPIISIDGRVMVSPALRPPRRITDIVQWLQAFSIFASVLVATFSWRARDLFPYHINLAHLFVIPGLSLAQL